MGVRFRFVLMLLALLVGGMLASQPALAATPTCTIDKKYDVELPPAGTGMLSTIVSNVQNILDTIADTMFNNIVSDPGFQYTLSGIATLYIGIYGVLFMFGMVHITLHDFAMRLIKLSIIAMLMNGIAWGYFSNYVMKLFNDGTNQLIGEITSITVGGIPSDVPFAALDNALAYVISAKMGATLLAVLGTGPYGFLIGGILLMSLRSFIKLVMNALWVYVMSITLKTLLFGVAPIFLSCILFARTRHLFDGWLNQIINASLQPLLLFAFISFFVALIQASLQNVLNTPVCWMEMSDGVRGTPFSTHFWRFMLFDGGWQPFDGSWGWTGPVSAAGAAPITPMDIMIPLTLYLVVELAERFGAAVVDIAKELAGSAVDLRMGAESVGQMFSGGGIRGGRGSAGGSASRPMPGSPTAGVGGRAAGGRPTGIAAAGTQVAANTSGNTSGGSPAANFIGSWMNALGIRSGPPK